MSIFENEMCYFCDETYPHPSCFIENYSGIFICSECSRILHVNYNIQENGECCVCFEDSSLIKLPTCIHKVCINCCKTIYFGSTTNQPPMHWREMEEPTWPWPLEFEDNDPETIKYEEYCEYETKYFVFYIETSYDEIITIRDNLISQRPLWMNSEEFINYENQNFKYKTELFKLEKEWENYNENKTKGNSSCPLCRAIL